MSLLALLLCAGPVVAAEPEPGSGAALFEKIKALAGDWISVSDGDHGHGGIKGKIAATIRVTAGGSAVIETIFPGTPMEMVSVYHLDGKDLVMTHYCMAKNQPRFKVKAGDKPNTLAFEFVGGCNIDPAKDFYIQCGKVTLAGKDAMIGEWTGHKDGKKAEEIKLELARKK
jgi:hypothetical protein